MTTDGSGLCIECRKGADLGEEEPIICEVCKDKVDIQDYGGSCEGADNPCPHKLSSLCWGCSHWDEKASTLRCDSCHEVAHPNDTDCDESEEEYDCVAAGCDDDGCCDGCECECTDCQRNRPTDCDESEEEELTQASTVADQQEGGSPVLSN